MNRPIQTADDQDLRLAGEVGQEVACRVCHKEIHRVILVGDQHRGQAADKENHARRRWRRNVFDVSKFAGQPAGKGSGEEELLGRLPAAGLHRQEQITGQRRIGLEKQGGVGGQRPQVRRLINKQRPGTGDLPGGNAHCIRAGQQRKRGHIRHAGQRRKRSPNRREAARPNEPARPSALL